MRALVLCVPVVVGCASEQDLRIGRDPVEPVTTPSGTTTVVITNDPPDPPEPEESALEGTVCAPDGESEVAGALVRVLHDGGPSEAVTDGSGYFAISGLPPGTWPVEVSKGSFLTTLDVTLVAGEVSTIDVDECVPLDQGTTDIAVVTGLYDDIGTLLTELGLGYDTVNGISGSAMVDFLLSPSELAKYDIIFFNCGIGNGWIPQSDEVGDNLRDFVQAGGSIYASDWAYWIVESTWPAENDFLGNEQDATGALLGAAGAVDADVLDPAMIAALGRDTADLNYDLDGWAGLEGASAEVLIEGNYEWYTGLFATTEQHGPLATRLVDGDGQVIYTTFHNERQTTQDMLLLLQEIVLSL